MSETFFGDPGFYARRAKAYDAMLGSPTYNRVFWGTRPDQYAAFAARALGAGDGPLLEVAVGTARATALLHVAGRRSTTLVDLSAPMLEVARESIRRAAGGEVPGRITLECRDMLSPVDGRRYETILGLGLLHLVPDVGAVISGLGSQLQDHGSLHLASLIRGSARSNAYLKLLKAHGDIAGIRTAVDLYDLAVEANVGNVSVSHEGAMAYVTISR
ncbi:class I SAM-dependent methyltransferase [Paeniglutamicibacter kerguelensis]|uniref:SAM-dependent methyltransferase n=1 Tax=Paeniglutamicibacter kerguelensis TaxID=254788 RepID=A0ABS4XK47_9MICC|nr:class I SAM-dependent methyltransferase [Paeniglutamicibacter kerguelensis]MBP2388726.1 SAM-dependent methyltransferase [Paeniglutamicibacter kerguelensis]